MDHSYEEIRGAALDVLAGREQAPYDPNQYENLAIAVAEVFARRETPEQSAQRSRHPFHLSPADLELFLEVFWDLFRQGIITLGYNNSNRAFPFFRLSHLGKRLLENQGTYFFHDVSTYTNLLKSEVPSIDSVTLLYLQEALQAFRSGCILSSTVMLGVATEHTFLLLLEEIERSSTHAKVFVSIAKERTILQKINKFKNILEQQLRDLPSEIKEDLDSRFAQIWR